MFIRDSRIVYVTLKLSLICLQKVFREYWTTPGNISYTRVNLDLPHSCTSYKKQKDLID